MLIRLNGKYYTLDGLTLVEATAPETEPAEGEFYDGDALAAELDELALADLKGKAAEHADTYNKAVAAAKTGNRADLDAAKALAFPSAIAAMLTDERAAGVESLGGTADGEDGEGSEDGEGEGSEGEGGEGEGSEDAAGTDGEGSEDGDGDDGDGGAAPDLDGLSDEQKQLVTAAANILKGGGSASDLGTGNVNDPRKGGNRAAPALRKAAVMTANASTGVADRGAAIDDEAFAEILGEAARDLKGGRGRTSLGLAKYDMFGPQSNVVTASAGAPEGVVGDMTLDFRKARRAKHDANFAQAMQAAADDSCGLGDQRREVKDCGDMSSDLLNIVELYPAPHCELTYHVNDMSIADIEVGVWTPEKEQAYCDALDAWRMAVKAGEATADLYAALKAAEKQCFSPNCLAKDTVTWLPTYICFDWPESLEQCSPETARLFRRLAERAFIRAQVGNFLAYLSSTAKTVNVDASAAPFANAAGEQLDASCVVDYVLSSLEPLGVMAERVTSGNYALIAPYGMTRLLEAGSRRAETAMSDLSSIFGGINVLSSIDMPTGITDPYAALPAAAECDFTDLLPPTDWSVLLVDLDDYFRIGRPNVELGAQMTPESIKGGNRVFGGFQEAFHGYGKDGCHPAWEINLSNLCYTGAKVAGISPAGLCG